MGKKLLLINDLAGYGKVALSAMIPVKWVRKTTQKKEQI